MSAEDPKLEEVYVRSDRMVGRRIADEYVLVPIVGRGAEIDAIFNLNRVGAAIWEQLDGRRNGQEIVSALVERFDVDAGRARADYHGFIAKLLSIRAVAPVAPDPERSLQRDPARNRRHRP